MPVINIQYKTLLPQQNNYPHHTLHWFYVHWKNTSIASWNTFLLSNTSLTWFFLGYIYLNITINYKTITLVGLFTFSHSVLVSFCEVLFRSVQKGTWKTLYIYLNSERRKGKRANFHPNHLKISGIYIIVCASTVKHHLLRNHSAIYQLKTMIRPANLMLF